MTITQKSYKALEYDKILKVLSEFAKTEQSRRLCLDLTPFVKIKDIQSQIVMTREAKYIIDLGKDIPIENIPNYTKLREKNEYFSEDELVDIAKSIRTSRIVRNYLKENLPFDTQMSKYAENLYSNKKLEDKLLNTFDSNLMVKQDANKELKGLYASLRDTEINLKKTVQGLMNSSEFQKHLQENIYTMRDDRIVYYRSKTKDRRLDQAKMEVVVPKMVLPIIEKYRDHTGQRLFNFYQLYRDHKAFNKAINKGLKEIGELLHIDDLEYYAARHSWATIAINKCNIDKYTVHAALNHVDESMRVTDIYIERDFENENKANAKVVKYVFGK